MTGFLRDIRHGVRSLLRAPAFTVAAVLTLGLGIGANGAMFALANGILWQPLPVRDPDELVVLFAHHRASGTWSDLTRLDVERLRARREVFAGVIGYEPAPVAVGARGEVERTWGETVTDDYFEMLGAPPALGRTFTRDEAAAGAGPVVVLGHDLWRRRFASDPQVIGTAVTINTRPFTVVGVMPPGFRGVYYPGFHPDLWIPVAQSTALFPSAGGAATTLDGVELRVMARLHPGISPAQAEAAAAPVHAQRVTELPSRYAGTTVTVFRERDARPEPSIASGFALAGRLFLAIVTFVLLIACANVANLVLARARGRQREIGVRLALGGSRGRLVRLLMAESTVIAVLGGLAGLGFAAWASSAIARAVRLPTDIPFDYDFGLQPRTLLWIVAVSGASALLFGLVPALRTSAHSLVGTLKEAAPGASGAVRSRLRRSLVVAQVALSCVLLVAAGLAVRTLQAVRGIHPGFDVRGGLLATVSPDLLGYGPARGRALYAELTRRLTEVPGVRAASLAAPVPLDFTGSGGTVFVPGHGSADATRGGDPVGRTRVGTGFFAAIGTPLVDGRDFTVGDSAGAVPVAVVNESFVRRYWPGENSVGRQFRMDDAGGAPITIIGVARDAKYRDLAEPAQPFLYLPIVQSYDGSATIVVRADAGDPLALAPSLRRAIAALDPQLPVSDVRTMDALLRGRALLLPRLATTLAGAFGLLALALAVVGLAGVVAYTVGLRTREFGIRLALGATPGAVVAEVLKDGAALAGIGIAAGVVLALAFARLVRGLLYGVGPADPATFVVIAVALGAAAALASWLPARRAARIDPVEALRSE